MTERAVILVTGASGLIGSHLCKRLAEEGRDVVGLVHTNTNSVLESLKDASNFRIVTGDLRDSPSTSEIIKTNHIKTVFHTAAHLPYTTNPDFIGVNAIGTINLLGACIDNDVEEFIYTSSMSVYSTPPDYLPVDEAHPTRPLDMYGRTKLLGEKISLVLATCMTVTAIRYSGVYGKGMDNRAIARFVQCALVNEPLTVTSKGEHSSDFVCIADVVESTVLAWQRKKGGIYNIGSAQEVTIASLATKIIDLTRSKSSILLDCGETDRPFRFVADISKARRELGYSPRLLDDGLRSYIESL